MIFEGSVKELAALAEGKVQEGLKKITDVSYQVEMMVWMST